MEYKLSETDDYSYDIASICDYISRKLKAPYAAKRLRKRAKHIYLLLERTSRMFPEIDKYDRVKRRYRRAIINNFIMLYTIDEDDFVYISHLYYDGRDYLNELL